MQDLLADLNDAQRRAVTHGEGPLLIVAGPGSGKTRVVSRRVAWLLHGGVATSEILAVTFTNKAAAELKERVQAILPAAGLWVSTFHSSCARILRESHADAGLPPNFTIYDEEDRRRLAGRVLRELGVPSEQLKPAALVRQVSAWKGSDTSPAKAAGAAWGPREESLAKGYVHYEKLLAESGALDFDDLLLRAHRLLEGNAGVLDRYRRRFRHVLVDEYQDTNRVQFLLARALASGTRNLCATGDPDQSIYGWRGADIRNILDFEEHYPDATVVRLEENYRSTRRILDAAGALIRKNVDRREKELRTSAEVGAEVRVEFFEDADAEGEGVGDAIRKSLDEGTPAHDIAVLYRVNSRSRAVERGLRLRRIPYQVVRGVEFFQRAEVKDLVAWLRILENPRDGEAFARMLEAPRRGAGETARGKVLLAASERGIPVRDALFLGAEVLGVGGKPGKGLDAAATALRELLGFAASGVAVLLERLLSRIDYRGWLEQSGPEDHQERWENVEELVASARAYDVGDEGGAGLAGFLADVALVSDQDRFDDDAPRVTLMTIHACKGLEFPSVYIVGVEEGVLPLGRSTSDRFGGEDASAVEEERRLLFVGMTRARRRLWLSAAMRSSGWTGGGRSGPSRFLDEIGREGIRRGHRAAAPADSWGHSPSRGFGFRRGRAVPEGADPEYAPAFDEPPAEELARVGSASFRIGQRVRHARFGTGKVRRLEQHGPVIYATVEFREGTKKLDLEKARLEPLGDGA